MNDQYFKEGRATVRQGNLTASNGTRRKKGRQEIGSVTCQTEQRILLKEGSEE
ncbi:hypothetical protein SIL77_03320 [Exiguobacterium profundum]|uniref:hypothetical protein n=1 Tax=Exiguobacterium profundum TaxID=307643 RepID=UPI0029C44F3A|nr:hypothetical protein [Exiguobacterium profundum]MDX5980298.1 hypothetical protein [Exiguobacterium profundum]